MSVAGISPEPSGAEGATELPRMALAVVERAIVKRKSRRVEVYFTAPFRHDVETQPQGDEADADDAVHERLLDQARIWLQQTQQVREVCEATLAVAEATVEFRAPVWEMVPTRIELRALVAALIDWYGESEPVAVKWLLGAQWHVRRGDARAADEERTTTVTFVLRNEKERTSLERKQTTDWLAAKAGTLFGLDLVVHLSVDAAADSKEAALREELVAIERREVMDVIAREQEAATRPAPDDTSTAVRQPDDRRRWERKTDDGKPVKPLTLGRSVDGPITPIHDIVDEMRRVTVEGRVFGAERRNLPSGRTLYQFQITDETDSITAKVFAQQDRQAEAFKPLLEGAHVRIQGQVQFDTYAKEIVLQVQDMQPAPAPERIDSAVEKRVELHLHTNLSALDGVTSFAEYVKQAAKWGHSAIAVTDHGVVQAFPDAYELGHKHGVKVLLGVEAYVVDDGTPIVYRPSVLALDDSTDYVVFDTETTGLNAREDTLIEIAAVRLRGREIVDTYSSLIDPERVVSAKITELTGISSEMLVDQPKLADVLTSFRAFANDAVLVAHNAEFDIGFLSQCLARVGHDPWTSPVIDTLALARVLYPGEKNYRLKTLTQKFAVELVNHHRALADAEATAKVFAVMQQAFTARGAVTLEQLNQLATDIDVSRVRPFHATLLVRNQAGLRNLYELISLSHTQYLYRTPRIPRSELIRHREGLLIGTACQQGELVQAYLRGKSAEDIEEICRFYDFLEIQPPSHYEPLIRDELLQGMQSVRTMHKEIVELGKRLERPVVATGDVHFLHPTHSIYREIFLQSQHGQDAAKQPPLYLRTTDEMLSEFGHLGTDAWDVVVHHPTHIASLVGDVKPIPDELYTPVIPGAEDDVKRLSYETAAQLYGTPLPALVELRLEKELNAIINNGFAVIYLIAHKLVAKSLADGYLVGSRGSVGSSLVATMTGITEVNPLPPHYRCPACQYTEFMEDGSVGSGFDLPDRDCPRCGQRMAKDGQDIPFETFMGFEGDKVPDIDLNFSGEYQPRAHKHTEELFGKDHVFRAGTISAVAEKTAYGYVRKFAEERGLVLRNAEIDRLVKGCTGVKRTTGQHPGGQVVVPRTESIYSFTPVQYPADDKNAGTLTTHFDYHSGLERCLLKLDILGHDDPTVIRMLQDLTGVDPKAIPMNDPVVIGLWSGTETLGVRPESIRSVTGTYAIPEMGTKFVRQMLEDTRPTTFSELVRISGLSHGTDVWLNNAQELIRSGSATLSEVICARDDIMVYLMHKGLDPSRAFKIMESIRKGKGVKEEDAQYMRDFGVPEWYIESGRRIKYMFPKAHAAAYVIMAVRIAWFKIYHPLAFYATYFSVRADDFDVALMVGGREAILRKIEELEQKGNGATAKEKGLLTALEVALEMVVRGFHFRPVDLYQSHATRFQIDPDATALVPPFAAIQGIGEAAATNLHHARDGGPFLSVEDLQTRSRVSKSIIEVLDGLGCLSGMPESNQLSLF